MSDTTADFSDKSEAAIESALDEVIDVLEKLSHLHTTTRMQVLATSYPALYQRIARVNELSNDIFGGR